MLAAAPSLARPVETLTRSENWVASYDQDSCSLATQLGTGKSSVIVRFTRYQQGDFFDLSVYGDRFGAFTTRVEGSVDFGLGGKPIYIKGLAALSGTRRAMFFGPLRLDGNKVEVKDRSLMPQPVTPEQEARVTGVTLSIVGRPKVRLEFGSLAAPMAEMRRCVDDLVKSWGYDPVQQATALRPVSPITPVLKWIDPEDFPMDALYARRSGVVQFRLDVDPEGKVLGCHVLARTDPDEFADTTCRALTKGARLQPALDAQGRPMRSYWVSKLTWLGS